MLTENRFIEHLLATASAGGRVYLERLLSAIEPIRNESRLLAESVYSK